MPIFNYASLLNDSVMNESDFAIPLWPQMLYSRNLSEPGQMRFVQIMFRFYVFIDVVSTSVSCVIYQVKMNLVFKGGDFCRFITCLCLIMKECTTCLSATLCYGKGQRKEQMKI